MKIQDKLLELSKYNIGFNVYDGKFIINLTYPESWAVMKPVSENITYYSDSSVEGKYYYIAPVSMNIDDVFSEIDNTIYYNIELENKTILFKEKIQELQDIFVNNSLEELNTLEFKLKTSKKKRQKKERKNKEDVIMSENPYYEIDNTQEEKIETEIPVEENKTELIIDENNANTDIH